MVEVTVRQEIGFLVVDVIPFLAENVLLLDAIILSQHFDDIHKQLMEIVVSLNIGSILNHRVLAFDDNRVIANHVVHDRNVIYGLDADDRGLKSPFFVFHIVYVLSNFAILQLVMMKIPLLLSLLCSPFFCLVAM